MNFRILLSLTREMASPISPGSFQRFRISVFQLLILLTLSTLEAASAQTNVTPAQYLASQPKPVFAPANHLPPLTRVGGVLSSNTTVELANNWGYSLTLSGLANTSFASLYASWVTNPTTFDYGMAQLLKSNPAKYKLSVFLDRTFPSPIPNGFYVTNANGWFVDNNSNTWQYATSTNYTPVVSPEAPDYYLSNSAAYAVAPLSSIQSNVPIAIVLNIGEYGLGFPGMYQTAWQFDPRVIAALATNGLSMYRYGSNQKAHHLAFTTQAINRALPNRELYIFYDTGHEQSRTQPLWTATTAGRGVWTGMLDGWNSDVLVTNSDVPSFCDYYYAPIWCWTNVPNLLVYNIYNELTEDLDAVGYNIALGQTTNYSWVGGGWDRGNGPSDFSDIPHYMGFLKCIYTSGTVGAVAGYFATPTGGFNAFFPTNNPPQWLQQMQALAHVHALFSHFYNFLSSGDLLSGPQHHAMSADQPAYEFTNTAADATARVLARKLRGSNQWLVTAWAAAGADRTVTVTIPTLGSVSVLARACGSVYQATTTNLTLIDTNGLLPSASFSAAPGPPTNLHVIPGSTN